MKDLILKTENMIHKRLKLSAALLIGLGLTGLHAQESINTTGGNASGSGGSMSYSVGQIVYTTNTGEEGSVTQGAQQAFEISVLGIDEFEEINPSITIYPNPTSDYLTLNLKEFENSSIKFQLFNIQGRILKNQEVTDGQTRIVMDDFAAATYFIKVSQDNKEIKTFKIVKK